MLALWILFAACPAQADDLVPGYWEQSPLPQTGLATYYAPGMMEYVEGYRQTQGQLPACPECVGTVALLRAGDIGRKVWLQQTDGERVGPFLVIDCARRQDVAPLVARDWVVDVSYELGQAWAMNRPLAGVTVLEDPADATVGPVRLGVPTPFFVPAGEVVISAPTATPAETAAAPTPWPTRFPAGMATRGPTAEATRTSAPAPPTPRLPPPLTPIVTTPTPRSRPTPVVPVAESTLAPEPAPPTETPVAHGRRCVGGSGRRRVIGTRVRSDARAHGHLAHAHRDAPAARPDAPSRSDAHPAAGGEHAGADERTGIAAPPVVAGRAGSGAAVGTRRDSVALLGLLLSDPFGRMSATSPCCRPVQRRTATEPPAGH